MEELLRYFIQETNEKLMSIETKLEDLQEFKVEMMASARITSLIISSFCGLVTLLTTLVTVYYTRLGAVK